MPFQRKSKMLKKFLLNKANVIKTVKFGTSLSNDWFCSYKNSRLTENQAMVS